MDHITIEKLLAMKKFKKSQSYILHKFMFYTLAALACILFCTSPAASWVVSFLSSSSIKLFLSVSLPNLGASIFNPKCLFIVCNIIVVFLIGESKFLGSKSLPTATDVYDEYVKRRTTTSSSSSSSSSSTSHEEIKKERKMKYKKKLELHLIDESNSRRIVKEERVEEYFDGEEEEECFLGGEELKKRVENFIERVKKQRKLEISRI